MASKFLLLNQDPTGVTVRRCFLEISAYRGGVVSIYEGNIKRELQGEPAVAMVREENTDQNGNYLQCSICQFRPRHCEMLGYFSYVWHGKAAHDKAMECLKQNRTAGQL